MNQVKSSTCTELKYDEVYSPLRQYGQYSDTQTDKQTDRQTDTNTIRRIQ